MKPDSLFVQRLIVAIALIVLGIAAVLNFWQENARTFNRERDRLLIQAQVIKENISQNLLALNGVLLDIRQQLSQRARVPDFNDYLKTLSDGMAGVRMIAVLDRNGRTLAASRSELVGLPLVSPEYRDRAEFQRADVYSDPGMVYVSPPFRSTLGSHVIAVSRVLTDARGRFAGTVLAILDPNYFAPLLGSILYAPDMRSALVHWDGGVFLAQPERHDGSDIDFLRQGRFFGEHRQSGRDITTLANVAFDGGERMIVQHTIRPPGLQIDKPLVVEIDRGVDDIFAKWREDLRLFSLLYVLILAASLFGLYAYQRKHREAELALAESEWWLRTIIEADPECVTILDGNGVVQQINPAGIAMLGGGTAQHVTGTALRALVVPQYQAAVEALIADVNDGRPGVLTFELIALTGKHCWIECHAVPMRDRAQQIIGSLNVMRDITDRKNAEQELQRLAQTDFLTGLANRRHFMELAEQEFQRCARYGGPLAVLMADIDRFKSINDTYGHKAGDAVIRRLAEICRNTLRSVDIAGRLGGEEFAVLLPQTDLAHASEVAELLRKRVGQAEVHTGSGQALHFTVSIGVAGKTGRSADIETLLAQADEALYAAKNSGRNKVREYRRGEPGGLPAA